MVRAGLIFTHQKGFLLEIHPNEITTAHFHIAEHSLQFVIRIFENLSDYK